MSADFEVLLFLVVPGQLQKEGVMLLDTCFLSLQLMLSSIVYYVLEPSVSSGWCCFPGEPSQIVLVCLCHSSSNFQLSM